MFQVVIKIVISGLLYWYDRVGRSKSKVRTRRLCFRPPGANLFEKPDCVPLRKS